MRGDRKRILGNLRRLDEVHEGPIAARTPVVGTVNDMASEIESIAKMLSEMKHLQYYQLMPYHGLGKAKYDALDQPFEFSYQTPSPETIAQLEALAAKYVPVFNIDRGMTTLP